MPKGLGGFLDLFEKHNETKEGFLKRQHNHIIKHAQDESKNKQPSWNCYDATMMRMAVDLLYHQLRHLHDNFRQWIVSSKDKQHINDEFWPDRIDKDVMLLINKTAHLNERFKNVKPKDTIDKDWLFEKKDTNRKKTIRR